MGWFKDLFGKKEEKVEGKKEVKKAKAKDNKCGCGCDDKAK